MSIKNGKDFLYVIWKDPKSRRQFIIGKLSKNGLYEFSYEYEINEAIKAGFNALISFDDISKTYYSEDLFSPFASRLPDKKRKDIDKILDKYDMSEYDTYELLKRSGARLPIDTLEFVDPIPLEVDKNIIRYFYIAGVRHYAGCEGYKCDDSIKLESNETLILELEPENKFDPYAIKVFDKKNNHLGYIPRYYSGELTSLINRGLKYNCIIKFVNKENNCDECIKIKLEILFDVYN